MQATDKLPVYPDLAGKVVVVTGGSGGIGAATCRLFAANGAKVAVNGRDPARIDAVVDAIRAGGGQAVGVAGDCADLAAVQRLRRKVEQQLGPAEVLAAFVGGGRARPGPVAQVPVEDWHSTMDGTLTATFLTLKSFLPGMIQRGRGAILTMASSAARLPGLGAPAPYVAAKAGVVMLTRQVASEVGRHGVRVNCLAPGVKVRAAVHIPGKAPLEGTGIDMVAFDWGSAGRLGAALEGGAGLLRRLCRATARRDPGAFAAAARRVGSGGW
jgi:3-oxoacyl-[acyl-carrier protein] reductase